MSSREDIEKEIAEARKILEESQNNLAEKPDDYSAQLLVLSMENHLGDLIKKLDQIQDE